MLNDEGSFCNIPNPSVCAKCLPKNPHGFTTLFSAGDILAWRAVWGATRVRTRPVLMTAIADIVSMVPVAIGSDILRPMAVTVMGGMFSSTILTLVLLPCLYILMVRYIEMPFFGGDDGNDELAAASEERSFEKGSET